MGPRNVILHRAKRGFGFILRGAKAASPLMQLKPSERCPGLQYLDDVDPGGVADMAGLRPGDFLLDVSFCALQNIFWIYKSKLIPFSDQRRRCSRSISRTRCRSHPNVRLPGLDDRYLAELPQQLPTASVLPAAAAAEPAKYDQHNYPSTSSPPATAT